MVLGRWLSNLSPSPLTRALTAYRQLDLTAQPPLRPPRAPIKQVIRLNDHQVARLVERYESGATDYELAREFGISRGTVSTRLKTAGVQLRLAPITKQQLQTAIELYSRGWSFARIGEHLGKDPTGIWRAFKLAGIPRRDTHGRDRSD